MAEIEPLGRRPSTRVEYIDVLRFVAALSVVAFHWLYNGVAGEKVTTVSLTPAGDIAKYGSIGVAQFFVISGFVIGFSASRGSAGKFAAGRALRLYPAYWVALVVTTGVVALAGAPEFGVTVSQFLANVTMMPALFGEPPIDGVYWTLSLELVFYAAVFAVLFLGFRKWLPVILPGWALSMLALALIGVASVPLFSGYFCYFAGGAIIDLIRRHGFSLYRLAGLVAAVATSILFTISRIPGWGTPEVDSGGTTIRIALDLVCFGVVLCALIPRVAGFSVPGSRWLGAVTYPMYLLHAHIGYVILNRFATNENFWVVIALMLAGLILSAWLLHRAVEVQLTPLWRALFGSVVQKPIDAAARLVPWGTARTSEVHISDVSGQARTRSR
ncbi:acyltransferase family protein [Microbacterium sp. NPDC055455]